MKNIFKQISEVVETLKDNEGYYLKASEKEMSLLCDHAGHRIIIRSNGDNFSVRDLTDRKESKMTTIELVCYMNNL